MTPYAITFSVPWVHGWQRAGVNFKTKDHYTRARTEADEQEIALRYKAACREKYGVVLKAPQSVPVTLHITACSKRPKKWPKYLPESMKPRIPYVVKPDADNIAKLMDGLNGVAWHDDAQVTKLVVTKRDREDTRQDMTVFTVIWATEGDEC